MDVVAHNVAGFDVVEDSAPQALVRQVQDLFREMHFTVPTPDWRQGKSDKSDLPIPPCTEEGGVFNFAPRREAAPVAKVGAVHDYGVTELRFDHPGRVEPGQPTDVTVGAKPADQTHEATDKLGGQAATDGKSCESAIAAPATDGKSGESAIAAPANDGKSGETTMEQAAAPAVDSQEFSGSLFLIGGSADNTFAELFKLAPKNPKIAVVGRASGLADADESLAEDFFKAGIKLEDITIVVPKDFVSKDKRFKYSYDVPSDADIVYFGGGAQDKLRKEFDDHQLQQVKELLKNGALVGGSSAGAAVMSEEMINGGDEKKLEQAHGFGLTPWAILDTHVGQRHREARDVKALYEIGESTRPVIGLDEDTRVRFFWKDSKLFGEVGGKGMAKVFQTPEMPALEVNRSLMPKILTDGGKREAHVWELKQGDVFEVRLPKYDTSSDSVPAAVAGPVVYSPPPNLPVR